jgi:hypothetical protein
MPKFALDAITALEMDDLEIVDHGFLVANPVAQRPLVTNADVRMRTSGLGP